MPWDPKDPSDTADYWWDFGSDNVPPNSRFLPPGETISTFTVTVPTGLTSVATSVATPLVRVRLSGGVVNTTYDVTCQITTSAGQVFEITSPLLVAERTS